MLPSRDETRTRVFATATLRQASSQVAGKLPVARSELHLETIIILGRPPAVTIEGYRRHSGPFTRP